jgi:hypothetical protein
MTDEALDVTAAQLTSTFMTAKQLRLTGNGNVTLRYDL